MGKLNFESAPLDGAWIMTPNPYQDDRGMMVRTFCRNELADAGIEFGIAQTNASINPRAGTLRGMHLQVDPVAKGKIVRCVRGSVYDVIVDLRPDSPTYLKHFGIELSADNMTSLVIPKSFAHGFLTLEDNTELHYMVDNFYTPELGRGLRYDDPALGINWPKPIEVISDADRSWPLLEGDDG